MAEIFTNFISTKKGTGTKTIVPMAGTTIKTDDTKSGTAQQMRDSKSVAQVHSIYVCQKSGSRLTGDTRYEETKFSTIDLYITNDSGDIVYAGYDIQIVPGSPYYIEKNITLTDTQSLVLNVNKNPDNSEIHVIASTVLFVEEVE